MRCAGTQAEPALSVTGNMGTAEVSGSRTRPHAPQGTLMLTWI